MIYELRTYHAAPGKPETETAGPLVARLESQTLAPTAYSPALK